MVEIKTLRGVPIVLLALMSLLPLQAVANGTTPKPSAVDPKAKEILQQMGTYMRGLTSFKVRVQTTREVVLPTSQVVDTDHTFDLSVQRPNRLYGVVQSATGEKQFFYNGSTFTLYTPQLKTYASFPAPPTLDKLFQELASKYGIEMPAADLIYSRPDQALAKGIISAAYVGESQIDGVNTHQIAVRMKDIDWQIWIEDGPNPLPRRLVIQTKTTTCGPRYMANFSGWDVNPSLDPSMFTFVPGSSDKKIDIKQLRDMRGSPAAKGRVVPSK